MCAQLFFLVSTLGIAHYETEAKAPGWGMPAIGIAFAIVIASLVPTLITAAFLTEAQENVQSCEAALRAAHAKCRLFAESVCFYMGEDTEARTLDTRFERVRAAFWNFAYY